MADNILHPTLNGADQTLVRSVCVIGTIAYGNFISIVRCCYACIAMGAVKAMQKYHERVAIDLRGI